MQHLDQNTFEKKQLIRLISIWIHWQEKGGIKLINTQKTKS